MHPTVPNPNPNPNPNQAFLWLNDAVIAAVMRSGVVRLLMREDDAVLEEQHRGSAAGAVNTAVLLSGY